MSNAAIEVQLRELKDLTAQLNTTVKQQSSTISAMTDPLASSVSYGLPSRQGE